MFFVQTPPDSEMRASGRDKDKRENEIPSWGKYIHTKNTETKSAGRQKAVWPLQPCNPEVTFQRVTRTHSSPCTEQKLFQAIASFMKYSIDTAY